MSIISNADLDDATGELGINNDDTRSFINNFYNVHRLWFEEADFSHSPAASNGLQARYIDQTEPALFLTRLLVESKANYREGGNGNFGVRGLRSEGPQIIAPGGHVDTKGFIENHASVTNTLSQSAYNLSRAGLERGDLIGIYKYLPQENSTFWGDHGTPYTEIVRWWPSTIYSTKRNFGGGIAGLQSFLIMNSGFAGAGMSANGAEALQRRWAKNALQLLCRPLPVVRAADVNPIVIKYNTLHTNPKLTSPFRQAAACMRCHAAIDPMAALTRNIYYKEATLKDLNDDLWHLGTFNGTPITLGATIPGRKESGDEGERYGDYGYVAIDRPPSLPSETTINPEFRETSLVARDPSFAARPPFGVVRFRSYTGELQEHFINAANSEEAISKLGEVFAQSDDLYACAAKRYFKFFTGIDVDLSDPGDLSANSSLSPNALAYRELVIELGQNLKGHQKLRLLIKEIMELPLYKRRSMRNE